MWPSTSAWRHTRTSQPTNAHALLLRSVATRGELQSIGVRRANHFGAAAHRIYVRVAQIVPVHADRPVRSLWTKSGRRTTCRAERRLSARTPRAPPSLSVTQFADSDRSAQCRLTGLRMPCVRFSSAPEGKRLASKAGSHPAWARALCGMSERCCPARTPRQRHRSARKAGIRSGWLEEAQDQKSWLRAQFLVVLGITLTHCLGRDRLDEFFDEEPSIGGSRAQS
jgi:hypothetical protein